MSQTFCTQCGAPLPPTGNFCPACGAARPSRPVAAAPQPDLAPALDARPTTSLDGKRTPAQRSPMTPVLAFGALLLLGVAVYFAFLRPQAGVAQVEGCVVGQPCADGTPADVQNAEGIPYPEIARIAPADAMARLDAGSAVFVDVRDEESFAAAHIPGSILIPLNEIETLGKQLPVAGDIILYCT